VSGLSLPSFGTPKETFSDYGQLVLAASSVGQFGAILDLALFNSESGAGFGTPLSLLIGFAMLVLAVLLALSNNLGFGAFVAGVLLRVTRN
jgi:hypothetical protein